MGTERLGSFLQSVERAEIRGVVFDRPIVEQALVAVTEGRLPPPTDQSILEGFLVFVGGPEADGIFDIREKEHAAWFLDRLRKGNYQSPIPELAVITRAPPPPVSPRVVIRVPAGTEPMIIEVVPKTSLQPAPPKPVSKMMQPLPPFQHDRDAWKLFGEFATSPGMNALLMPLGVVEHVMATFITGEISWQESWDEGVGALGGSAVMGGGLLATVFTWHQASKVLTDPRIKKILDGINNGVSPRVRGYLLPALFLSAFAFMALRASQDLPIEEVWFYRRNMFQEMLEGLGMGYVVTGGALFTFHRLATLGERSVGKNGARGIWLTAMAAGFLAQELWSSWRRQQKNREFKEKTYQAIVDMLDLLPTVPEHMRAPILENCDRKFAMLVALNMLEFSSIKEAIEYSEKQTQTFENYKNSGLSETWAKKWIAIGEKKEPLTKEQQAILEYWLSKTGENKERASMLPVSMLSAQRRRILGLWQNNLADVYQFLAKPIPIMIGRNADGSIPSGQFADWHVAHTMALLRQYAALRERLQVQNGPLPHPVSWH